jgi:hypothetical protein
LCCMFCRSLFVLLSFGHCVVCFVDRCLSFCLLVIVLYVL